MLKNKKIFILVVLCIQIILSCFVLNANDTISLNKISYNDYLEDNVVFESKSIGYGHDNCTFYFNKEDNNYFYKLNLITQEKTKILEKNVITYYPYKDNLYCILDDNSIIRINVTGENETLIYKGENKISTLYADDYALYFMMDNTVCRYFMSEKILDKLIYHENLYYFIPISNYKIVWSYLTPEWLKYLEETGDLDNQNYIKTVNIMSYDVLSKQNIEIDDFTSNIVNENDEDKEVPPNIIIATNPSYSTEVINGLTIPMPGYPAGSYFSSLSTGCTCHGTTRCNYTTDTLCDCTRAFNQDGYNAIQCHGFGCYVYRYIWGITGNTAFNPVKEVVGTDFRSDAADAAIDAKTYIENNLNAFSIIRFTKRIGGLHTIFIAKIDAVNNRIIAYHANTGSTNNCKIAYEYINYATIGSTYSGVSYAYKG